MTGYAAVSVSSSIQKPVSSFSWRRLPMIITGECRRGQFRALCFLSACSLMIFKTAAFYQLADNLNIQILHRGEATTLASTEYCEQIDHI